MDANEIQSHMRENLKDKSVADNIILWKIYENRHQSVIIYPSEESAETELAKGWQIGPTISDKAE